MRTRTTRTRLRPPAPPAWRPSPIALASAALAVAIGLGGCATVPTGGQEARATDPRDPWEAFNRRSLAFNDTLDRAILKPAAQTYNKLPRPVRTAISNVFSNLGEVVVVANDLLQLKFRQGAQDTARFVMNSTFGLLGTVDFVGRRGLPKHDEDFGQTLGYWGVPPGPYLVIPFLGPSDVRDGIARFADYRITVYPQLNDTSVYWSVYAVDVLHTRADLLGATSVLETAALDRYNFLRDAFLQRRLNQVYDGHPPKQKDDSDESDADAPGTPGATKNGGEDEPPAPPKFKEGDGAAAPTSGPAAGGGEPPPSPQVAADGADAPTAAPGPGAAGPEAPVGETDRGPAGPGSDTDRVSQAGDIELPTAGTSQDAPAADIEVPATARGTAMETPGDPARASGATDGEIETPAAEVAPAAPGAGEPGAASLEGKF
jgi:phospholipid-binding lipoprotein MlaA